MIPPTSKTISMVVSNFEFGIQVPLVLEFWVLSVVRINVLLPDSIKKSSFQGRRPQCSKNSHLQLSPEFQNKLASLSTFNLCDHFHTNTFHILKFIVALCIIALSLSIFISCGIIPMPKR